MSSYDYSSGLVSYRLVLHPNPQLKERIVDEQQRFIRLFGCPVEAAIVPQLILAQFRAPEPFEATLVRWFERSIGLHDSFTILLNNYACTPDHSVCIRLQDPLAMVTLAGCCQPVQAYLQSTGYREFAICRRPQLPFLCALSAEMYDKACGFYARQLFRGSLSVNELVLLKEDAPDRAKAVNIFQLKPVQHSMIF